MSEPTFPRADDDSISTYLQQIQDLLYVDPSSGLGNVKGAARVRAERLMRADGEVQGSPVGTLYDQTTVVANKMMALFDTGKLSGQYADAFKNKVIPTLLDIVASGIKTMFELTEIITRYKEGGYPSPQLPTPENDWGYLSQRFSYAWNAMQDYYNWRETCPDLRQQVEFMPYAGGGSTYYHHNIQGSRPGLVVYRPYYEEVWKNADQWIFKVLRGECKADDGWSVYNCDLQTRQNYVPDEFIAMYTVNADQPLHWDHVGRVPMPAIDTSNPEGPQLRHSDHGGYVIDYFIEWPGRSDFLRTAYDELMRLEPPVGTYTSYPAVKQLQGSWSRLTTTFTNDVQNLSGGWSPGGGYQLPPQQPPVPPIPPIPPSPPVNPGPPPDSGPPVNPPPPVDPTPIPQPTLQQIWSDQRPNQFPEPQNLGDLAREMVRRQGGRNHLLLISHCGPRDQNNWLVTIPDVGNKNYIQDPGDPGLPQGGAGAGRPASALTAGDEGYGSLTNGTDPSHAGAVGPDTTLDNSYLNNMASVRMELGGRLSPFGRFVAEAIQQYCTSQLPKDAANVPSDLPMSGSAVDASSLSAGSFGDSALGSMLSPIMTSRSQGTVQAPSGPPTSPNFPANLWLAGHGLGGMVAQNLAGATPFPGDNPNFAPAHVVKGVIALGAPIVGTLAKGVVYSIFRIKGDRLGDIPIDTVGVNDARTQAVHEIANPFTQPPWQSADPSKPDYVKDPNDPSTIHTGYADAPELDKAKLPFDLKAMGGAWGPTYVVPIPQNPTSPIAPTPQSPTAASSQSPVPSLTGSSNIPSMGQ